MEKETKLEQETDNNQSIDLEDVDASENLIESESSNQSEKRHENNNKKVEKGMKLKKQNNENNFENQKFNLSDFNTDDFIDFKAKKIEYSLENKNEKDATYIFAVGGIDEIGKNTYAIEHNEETIVVDAGIKFASNDLLGINGLIPNYEYFIKNKRPIDLLIITHGHEDHIGGVPYLLRKCEVKKILSPLLASELIKRKLGEHKDVKVPEIEVFSDNSVIKTKYFDVDFFRVCHSIPDCFGIAIKTPNGNIVSAGDYRFDFGCNVDNTNIHKIIEISNRKVDIFLAESTNSDQEGFSESEDLILKNIEELIKNSIGRVFISTFASNLGRIEKIIESAINLNRKICIMGRSMEANIKTSRKVGYLKTSDIDFLSSKEVQNAKDENVLVILTGSQGEEMAALNLMAENKYSKIVLKPSDTIMLSSNPIPGNFKNVENVVNKLFKLGVNVIQHSSGCKIHASGHATKQEQQMMMKLVNANYVIPIHGETKMLHAMRKNAVDIGYDKDDVFILTNGQKVKLLKNELTKTNDIIDVREVLIDGKNAAKETSDVVVERKIIAEEGVFNAILIVDSKNKKLARNPLLSTRGSFFAKEASSLISKISYSIKEEVEKEIAKSDAMISDRELEEICKRVINYFVWKNKRKKPVVLVNIFQV